MDLFQARFLWSFVLFLKIHVCIWTVQPWKDPKSAFVWAVSLFTGLYMQLLSLTNFNQPCDYKQRTRNIPA